MGRLFQQIRGYFGPREDPYAGGDLDNARRLGAALFTMGTVVVVALLPASPPTDAIGAAGWVLVGAAIATALVLIYLLGRTDALRSWRALYLTAIYGVLGLGVGQWLAGGIGAPYDRLMLLPVLYVAALHPPRLIAAFMGVVLLALAAPFVYDGWHSEAAASAVAGYVTWWAIALIANMLMTGVRAQRLSLTDEGAQAREEARRDPLTGLANRRAFEEVGEREIAQAHRIGVPLSLMLVDIERFKQVNDEFGHLEGDRCLREVAETIRRELRQPDLCFRWGGDEFALLLAGTDSDGADQLARRLRRSVGESCRRPCGAPVEIRLGAAELGGEGMLPDLVERADMALAVARGTRPATAA